MGAIQHQIEMEEAIRRNNHELEMAINLAAVKGGLPQYHKWQPKTAKDAFKKLKPGSRYEQILNCVRQASEPLTDRQIKDKLGYPDLNNIRPRVSELIDYGYLRKHSKRICPVTQIFVRTVTAKEQQDEIKLDKE